MGFINNINTGIKVVAKLTAYGRKQILSNSNTNVIKYFSLGDSDANYNSPLELNNGEIPTMGGDYEDLKTMGDNYEIRHKILVDDIGNTKKAVETSSNDINTEVVKLGQKTIDNTKISQFIVNRNDFNSDNKVNLLYSFGLPITENDKTLFNSVTNANGGFSDTALRNLNNDNSLVLSIDNAEYGELIDGKSIKLELTTLLDTFNVYGTFQNNQTSLETQDGKTYEITNKSKLINNNIIFLFSDKIKRPNGDATKSWSTGFGKTKPYSVNGKELFNLTENTTVGIQKDECVGVAYLDKGIIVITHPTIVSNYDTADPSADAVLVTYNSMLTKMSQDVTCVIGRGEFTSSTNKTYNNDDIRVSEIGIYDGNNKLIALAKTNQHLVIGNNEYMAIGVKISV